MGWNKLPLSILILSLIGVINLSKATRAYARDRAFRKLITNILYEPEIAEIYMQAMKPE
jgi:hypothetical protein